MNKNKKRKQKADYERGEAIYQRLLRGWLPHGWSADYRDKVLQELARLSTKEDG